MADPVAPAPEKPLPSTVTCFRCKRHMFSTELVVDDGHHVCSPRHAKACARMAGERTPRAKVDA